MEYDEIEIIEEREEQKKIKIPENRLVNIKRVYVGNPLKNETELDGKAIYLTDSYDWIIAKTRNGTLCCVPLERKD